MTRTGRRARMVTVDLLKPLFAVKPSAVDDNRLTADPTGAVRCEEHDHIGDLLDLRGAVLWLIEQSLAPARFIAKFLPRALHVDRPPALGFDCPPPPGFRRRYCGRPAPW